MARILALTNWFPPHSRGGYEILCEDVVSRLASRGHQIEVLCGDERMEGTTSHPPHTFAVHRTLQLYWRDGQPWNPPRKEQLAIERHNQTELSQILRRARPDVVSVWHMGALSLNLLTTLSRRRIPLVYGICDDWLNYGLALDPWAGRAYRSPVHRLAGRALAPLVGVPAVVPDLGANACFCFISAATRDAARAGSPWTYPVAPVVHAGIDNNLYPPPAEIPPRRWRWKLLYMGRLDERKGTHTLLRGLADLPERARLSIVGRGEPDEVARLKQLAAELGVASRVSFSWVNRHEAAAAYLDHDCVIFPSEWPEPFGLVPLEAMACGVPVVATGVGGSAEFLTDELNCLLYPAGDGPALARAVERLADDLPLRHRLRDNGFVTAKALDVSSMADAYEHCLLAAAAHRLDELAWPEPDPPGDDRDPLVRHRAQVAGVLGQAAPTPDAVKGLYQDLGRDFWVHYGSGEGTVPVLSAPETAPVVLSRFTATNGPILDAGCGPNPAVSIGLARAGLGPVVALDIGLGTVRVAVAEAARQGVTLHGVVADVEHLPFLDGAFTGVVCDDTIEHLPDDEAGVAELARVAHPDATVVLATPNRWNAVIVKTRMVDWWHGRRRPRSHYFVSTSHLREYTWDEFAHLVEPHFTISAHLPVGWEQTRKRKLASRFLRGPLRRASQMIVMEVHPRHEPGRGVRAPRSWR